MKIKMRLFLSYFFVGIYLILSSFSSYSQRIDLNSYPRNSTIYLSTDSLKTLYLDPDIRDSEILYSSKNDSKGNFIDGRNNVFILDDNFSSVRVIEELRKSIVKQKRIERDFRLQEYKRKRLRNTIPFYNVIKEFPIDIPFGTAPGDDDDGDLVINTNDDDDDNDGILDTDEGLNCLAAFDLGVDGTFDNTLAWGAAHANYPHDDCKNGKVQTPGEWQNGHQSADTWIGDAGNPLNVRALPTGDLNNNCSVANGMVPSPQGSVFVGGWDDAGVGVAVGPECFYVDIGVAPPALEISTKYKITFYQSMAGAEGQTIIGDLGRWRVEIAEAGAAATFPATNLSETLFSPERAFEGIGNQTWSLAELEFTAEATSHRIQFCADGGTDGVGNLAVPQLTRTWTSDYMVIDDIKMFKESLEAECTDRHSDNDGIPDHKDIDADGDGCPDTIEAGFTDGDPPGPLYGILGTGAIAVDPANGRVTTAGGFAIPDGYTTPANLDSPPALGGNTVDDYLQVGGTLNVTDFPVKQIGGYTKATEVLPGAAPAVFNVAASMTLVCDFCDLVDDGVPTAADNNPALLTPLILYAWDESTNGGTTWTPLVEGAPYSNVATSTLTINPTTRAMAGNLYRVRVMNPSFDCDSDVTTSDENYGVGPAAGLGQGLLIPNNCPVPDNDNYSVDEGDTLIVNAINGIKDGDIDADVEDDKDLLPITIVTPPSHGDLTCPPALAAGICIDGSFRYINNGDEFITDSFTYTLEDGAGCVSDIATVSLTINPINDVPLVVQDTYSVVENGTLTATDITGTAQAPAADDTNDNGVIVNDNDEGSPSCVGDCVQVAPGNNLTATLFLPTKPKYGNIFCPAAPGVFGVICGDGSFTYTHLCADSPNQDFFTYSLHDGEFASPTRDTVFINILNELPIGVDDAYSVRKGGSISISPTLPLDTVGFLKNDTDPNPCDINFFATQVIYAPPPNKYPNYGTVPAFGANGSFQYTHNCISTEPRDTIQYVVNDGEDQAADTTLIVLNIFDDVPIVNKDTFEVNEQDTLVIDLTKSILNNDVTLELCDSMFAYKVTDPAHHDKVSAGIFTLNTDGTFTYVHDCTDIPNQDFFVYMVRDGDGAGNFFHPNDSAILNYDTVFININNVCPVGEGDFYSVTEGGTISIPELLGVLNNDKDDNTCEVLTASLVTPPEFHDLDSGTFVLNPDGSFKYTHDHTENFIDEFSYTLSDGECEDAIYVATITIDSIPDVPPVPSADTYECILEGGVLEKLTLSTGVLGNDTDADAKDMPPIDTLEAILVDNVINGTLDFKSDGTFTYTHDGGETVLDSFSYYVTDGDFNSDTVLVTICINPVNDCPVPKDELFFINEGDTIDSTLVFNDFDIEGNFLTTTLLTDTSTIIGTLALKNNGDFVYISPEQLSTPAPGSETVVLSYRLSDGVCDTLPPSTCRITIFAINDCPVSVDDTVTVDGSKPPVSSIVNLIQNDSDPDSDLDTSSLTIQKLPQWGTTVLNGDGTVTYTYTGSPHRYDTLVYTIKDVEGCLSKETSLFINIDNLQYPKYTLANYFTPNGDNFNDELRVQLENIIIDNVKFEVLIMDRYQRKVFEAVIEDEKIWDGTNSFTDTQVKKDFYFYQIKPIEYGSTEGRDVVGVVFLDK